MRDAGEYRAHRRELLGLIERLALTPELGIDPLALGHVPHDRGQELDGSVGPAMGDGDDRDGDLAPVAREQHRLARPQAVADQRRPDLVVDDGPQPFWRQAGDGVSERVLRRESQQSLARGIEIEQASRQIRDRDQIGRRLQDRGEPLARLELEPQAMVEPRVLDGDRGVIGQCEQEALLDGGELARPLAADRQHGHQALGPDERRGQGLS